MTNQRQTMGAPVTETWIREPQLREYLQVSASTIRRLRTRGLPSMGRDRLRRYHLETVLRWLAEHL
jgi:phage terminase Nu1 subunit (DNA packaging protein)